MLAGLTAAVALLTCAPPAGAYLYWTDHANNVLGRANHLSGVANPDFHAALEPMGVGVDASRLFFGHSTHKGSTALFPGIASVGLGGGTSGDDETDLVYPLGTDYLERVEDVEVANGHVYWFMSGYPYADRIGSASLDGSGVIEELIVPGVDEDDNSVATGDLAVDSNYVYWSTYLGPARARLDGTSVEEPFISDPAPSYESGYGIAVDNEYLYWGAGPGDGSSTELVSRARRNGTDVDRRFIEIPPTPEGFSLPAGHLEVDRDHVYMSFGYRIGRANIDGSGLDPDFINLSELNYGSPYGEQAEDIELDATVGDPANPPPPEVPRSLTIKYSKRTSRFKGRIQATTEECRFDLVKVYRAKKGRDPKFGSEGSSSRGRWSLAVSHVPRAGRYYAVVSKMTPLDDPRHPCAAARSAPVRVGR